MPLGRSRDLIVEELGDELLVYDMEADRGHCLSPTAARVWRRCDGRTPPEGLSAQLGLDQDAVDRALEELAACELLEAAPEPTVVPAGNGATRRELASKVVKVGAVAAAAPLIVSVAAPTPAQAQTLAFCAQFDITPGCGLCQRAGCCCCTPAGGVDKRCVPPTAAGIAICCAEFGSGTNFAAGCPPHAPCPPTAETQGAGRQFEGQQPATSGTAPAPEPGTTPAPEPPPLAPEPTPVPEAPPPGTTTTTPPGTGAIGTEAAPTP